MDHTIKEKQGEVCEGSEVSGRLAKWQDPEEDYNANSDECQAWRRYFDWKRTYRYFWGLALAKHNFIHKTFGQMEPETEKALLIEDYQWRHFEPSAKESLNMVKKELQPGQRLYLEFGDIAYGYPDEQFRRTLGIPKSCLNKEGMKEFSGRKFQKAAAQAHACLWRMSMPSMYDEDIEYTAPTFEDPKIGYEPIYSSNAIVKLVPDGTKCFLVEPYIINDVMTW